MNIVMMHEAIYALYPNVITICDDIATNKDGKEVKYDKNAVAAKAIEIENEEKSKIQAQADIKKTALSKLSALGLTEDEIKALIHK